MIYVVLKNKHKELCTGTQHFLTSQMWVLWASIVHWICLRLPSCCPGFESQAHHLHFYQFIFELCHRENDENKQKEAELAHFFKKNTILSKEVVLTPTRNLHCVSPNFKSSETNDTLIIKTFS